MTTKRTEKTLEEENRPVEAGAERLFEKGQLIASKRFRNKRDLLNALLQDNKLYAVSEAEEMIEIYLKGTVE